MRYLYEPNASIMKAGCFAEVERQLGVQQIAENSHLFVSDSPIAHFPGRGFEVEKVLSMKEAQAELKGRQANVATRNFPLRAEELKKKLKVRDGGDLYLFGSTLPDGRRVIIFARHESKK